MKRHLPTARLAGERSRTVNQIKMFADLVSEGSWRDARIDRAMPERKPLAKPDLRRILIPIGPVAVWAASNFPLAFSVAGGDTISALAAGNPVVVKAHPGHPAASEMVAGAINSAIRACGLPEGIFSMIQGRTPETSLALLRHPLLKAGAFTGSLKAGRALYNAAAERETPHSIFRRNGECESGLRSSAGARTADGSYRRRVHEIGKHGSRAVLHVPRNNCRP